MAEDRVAQIAGHLNFPKGMLQGQVAIITGSGQGIGAEAARLFANEGAKVVVQDIDAGKPLSPTLLLDSATRKTMSAGWGGETILAYSLTSEQPRPNRLP